MRRFLSALALLVALAVALPAASYATIYVNTTGSGAGDGSAAAPFASIQQAVDVAYALGDPRVEVGPGLFLGRIMLKDGVSVYGAGPDLTTVRGTEVGPSIWLISLGAGETISGFSVSGGTGGNQGGGIACISSSPMITNNRIANNTAIYSGAGIYLSGSAASIVGNTIENNSLTNYQSDGAAIYCGNGSNPVISGNTILGNQAQRGGGGIFCYSGSSPTITQNTITGNSAPAGGAIGIGQSSMSPPGSQAPFISDNLITDNVAVNDGGAIRSDYSAPIIEDNTITGNSSSRYGGAISLVSSPSRIRGNTISGNSGGYGGGISTYLSDTLISENTVSNNYANGYGAGMVNFWAGVTVTDNTFSDNRTPGSGAGIMLMTSSDPIVVSRNYVVNNTAVTQGGGISVGTGAGTAPTLENNVVAGNRARNGAGIHIYADPVLRNNTIAYNIGDNATGASSGGGIYRMVGSPTVVNCIVWGNTADSSAQVFGPATSYSCVQGGTTANGNINAAPSFVATLAGDYRLAYGSPCVDTGTAGGAPAVDIAGVARPKGAAFDMGAQEFQPDAPRDISISAAAVAENAGANALVGTLSTVDITAGDTHTYSILAGGDGASFNISADALRASASFDFESKTSYAVEIRTTDSTGLTFDRTFTITVSDVNEAPVALGESFSVDEDGSLDLLFADILSNDSDVDAADVLSSVVQATTPNGSLVSGPLALSYSPATDFNGTDAFTYKAFDGGLYSGIATVTITVNPVNDAPSFTSGASVSVAEDSGVYAAGWATDILAGPANESGQSLSFQTANDNTALFSTQPTVSAAGVLTFKPAANAHGEATVTVTLTDDGTAGGAALSCTRAFRIAVASVPEITTLALTSGSATLATQGSAYLLTGRLTVGGIGVAGQRIGIQGASGGTVFSDTGLFATTNSDGRFSISLTPESAISYRAAFVGSGDLLSSLSTSVRVLPRAGLSVPRAAGVVYRGVTVRYSGMIYPGHAPGSRPVRIYRYRYVSGTWKSYGYVSATAAGTGSGSVYSAAFALPYAGTWRLRAYHPADAGHAASWSGYSTMVVKGTGDRAVAIARSLVGARFQWGGTGPLTFDSSGFARYVYARAGISLPRTAAMQYSTGTRVGRSSLRPGDLVFYRSPIMHVAIYVGNGRIVGPSVYGSRVEVRNIYWTGYAGATRPSAN